VRRAEQDAQRQVAVREQMFLEKLKRRESEAAAVTQPPPAPEKSS
jgi:hypothetical protein